MKQYVTSAELSRYNANNRGTNSPDCVKRALSLALDIPYGEISKLLNQLVKDSGNYSAAWNQETIYHTLMHEYGCSKWMRVSDKPPSQQDDPMTLEQFVDTVADPSKIYIVLTGSRPTHSDHMVCVRDGKVWDSWDSRSCYVFKYSIAPDSHRTIDTSFDIKPIILDYIEPAITDNMKSLLTKRGWEYDAFEINSVKKNTYEAHETITLQMSANEWSSEPRKYKFKINYAFSPTATQEEIIDYINKTTKQRVYDRLWSVGDQEAKAKEAAEIKRQAGVGEFSLYLDPREQRFYESLPGWVRPLILYMNIQNPGQYSDSYSVWIRPLPSDTRSYPRNRIIFESYDALMMKDMLRRYKSKGEVPFEDYEPWEEY